MYVTTICQSTKKTFLKQLAFKVTGIQLSTLADFYCYFLLAAHCWMSPNGVACWLIPAEFMDVYGKQIKDYLLNQVTLLRVHQFASDDLQFRNVLRATSVIWLKNTQPTGDYFVNFTGRVSISNPRYLMMRAAKILNAASKSNKTAIFNSQSINSEVKLSDLFEIKRGVATGANIFFYAHTCADYSVAYP